MNKHSFDWDWAYSNNNKETIIDEFFCFFGSLKRQPTYQTLSFAHVSVYC